MAAREERQAAERRAYDALKQDLWRWSVGVTALFFAGTILLFSRVRKLLMHLAWSAFFSAYKLPAPHLALLGNKIPLPMWGS